MRAAGLTLLALLPCMSIPLRADEQAPQVAILLTNKPLYERAAANLAARLDQLHIPYVVSRISDQNGDPWRDVREQRPDVIATAGAGLTEAALQYFTDTPVVYFAVPNALDADFTAPDSPHAGRVTGVTTDVAPEEQIRWIRQTDPDAHRIAVLHSSRTEKTVASLVKAGHREGLSLAPLPARRGEFPAAIEVLNQADPDGVLMIPDAGVFNAPSVERLLLWGARREKPVWAFSLPVVKAGAYAGVYCDVEDTGAQAAEIIQQILSGRTPEKPVHYPQAIGRVVNFNTARTIEHAVDASRLAADVTRFGAP